MGRVEIKIEAFLKEKGVSKNKICQNCGMQRTQLNNYCKNSMNRVDLNVISRLCEYLDCTVSDLLEYKND